MSKTPTKGNDKNNGKNKIKIKILHIKPLLTDEELDKKEGDYFPESHYKTIITDNCDVYGILDDILDDSLDRKKEYKLLLKFRKNVIPNNICKNAYLALEKHAQHKNRNRGAAAGKINIKKLPKYVGKLTQKGSFRVFYKSKSGQKTKDNIGNMAMSNIAGYYDKPDRNLYMNKKGKTKKRKYSSKKGQNTGKSSGKRGFDVHGNALCRTTQFTANEVEKWENTIPLIKEADKQFKRLVPDRHKIQIHRAQLTPKYQIANTAYSTITVNYDWQTACHKDRGDFSEGFGNLIVLEKSKSIPGSCEDYKGGLLGFPKWGIAVDVRQGDFLCMDVHEWHCNTPIIGGEGRLSVVCYLRENMINCR